MGGFAYSDDRYDFGLAGSTLSLLAAHPWPGNVRQLKDTLEQAASSADGPMLLPMHFRAEDRDSSASPARQIDDGEVIALDELERRHVLSVLGMTGGDTEHAAALLGIDQIALRRRLRRYGIVR